MPKEFTSCMIYMGTIIAIARDGSLWQWKPDYKGAWAWELISRDLINGY